MRASRRHAVGHHQVRTVISLITVVTVRTAVPCSIRQTDCAVALGFLTAEAQTADMRFGVPYQPQTKQIWALRRTFRGYLGVPRGDLSGWLACPVGYSAAVRSFLRTIDRELRLLLHTSYAKSYEDPISSI